MKTATNINSKYKWKQGNRMTYSLSEAKFNGHRAQNKDMECTDNQMRVKNELYWLLNLEHTHKMTRTISSFNILFFWVNKNNKLTVNNSVQKKRINKRPNFKKSPEVWANCKKILLILNSCKWPQGIKNYKIDNYLSLPSIMIDLYVTIYYKK